MFKKHKKLMLVIGALLMLGTTLQSLRSTLAISNFNPNSYEDLVEFFFEWREFHSPEMIDGIPDYTRVAMDKQYAELTGWQQRLEAFDTSGWSVAHRIDWTLIWAEMNGFDFAHRVKRPWERDPAFYVWFYANPTDVPEREGPNIYGAIELPNYQTPLSVADAAQIADRLRKAPAVFEQAQGIADR